MGLVGERVHRLCLALGEVPGMRLTRGSTSLDGGETMSHPVINTRCPGDQATPCSWNLTGPEGSLESPEPVSSPYDRLDCTYTISGYPGYGVEIKVLNISLSEGETVAMETFGGAEPVVLANESFLMRGQVIRSPTNRVSVQFRSPQPASPGTFRFRFQDTTLCPLLAPNPWPPLAAACGGVIRNATIGRIISPGFPGNYSNNLTCHWLLEAPEGQRLHLHFEKVSLAEDDDRLTTHQGDIEAPPVYDSYEVEYLPIEGLLSTARHFFLELTTDSSGASTGVALRYEAFEQGHCYKPFVKYGNFTTSDATYAVGTTVEFSCDPGYTLEQGSIIIECVDPSDPQWNETEPACRAVCSGEITDSAGVVLSPNWPEAYGKGQDCIWGLHVEEDKRIMLDVQVLHIGKGDVLTFYDGDDLTARILGQYTGAHRHFKLYTAMADVTIQFQSDPGSAVFGYQQGFVIHFFEVPRNDTCPELPEIPNGWKTTSHPELIHGTMVNYHCYPGFELVGTDLLMCHWDLTWSGDLPTCERVTSCKDPGDVDHSRRIISSSKFPVGSTVQFVCDKGYVLTGGSLLTCRDRQAGGPKWSNRLPKCTRESELFAKVSPSGNPQEGPNIAIAIFLPVLVVALLIGGIYLYFSKLQGKPSLQLPLSGSHPYDHITVESAFDNTAYETGDTREYEVSI
uniref:Seizure related 6 homolog n=1 Tax=Gopherus evgoodei TaxID=1825980 RepID=A0A8C4VYU5_9SAUR